MEGAHEQDAALLDELPMLLCHRKVRADHPLRGNAAQTDHDLWPQQTELFPQPGHAGLALGRQRVPVLGRAAFDDVGNIAVPAAVQIDGEQISIQQLAAAAHKRQALLILALAGAFAYKQYFGIFNTLTEHHVGAGLAQLAACAGQTARSQSFPIHDDTISS